MGTLATIDETALEAFDKFTGDQSSGGINFIKMTQNKDTVPGGVWVWGAEGNHVVQSGGFISKVNPDSGEEPENFIADMNSLSRGYTCWVNRQCLGEEMATLMSGRTIDFNTLPDHGPYPSGDGWKESNSIELESLNKEPGKVKYSNTSEGCKRVLSNLAKEFATRAKSGEAALIPIINLSHDSYINKKSGSETFVPVFEVVDWIKNISELDSEEVEEIEEESVVAEQPPEPVKPTRKLKRKLKV